MAREKFYEIPRREDTSHRVALFRVLFHVDNTILTKHFSLLQGMFSMKFMLMIRIPSCLRVQENMLSQCFSMGSGKF